MITSFLKDISWKINNQEILKNINLEISQGKITTLVGPNGGGKTSIARILAGILLPDSGQVYVKKNSRIGYMPQMVNVDHSIPLRVIDFIALIVDQKKNQQLIIKLAKRLGVEKILNQQLAKISGGQMQKVFLMQAIIANPDILILDEPTQFMDVAGQLEFYEIIEEIRREQECAILIISHDLHVVMQKTDHVVCVNHHICCQGSPEVVNNHPDYLSLFGSSKINNIVIYPHRHDHMH